jgi:MFS family permease
MMSWSSVFKIRDKLSTLLRLPRRNRLYLVSFVILVLSAILVGLDNPTGIIIGWLAVTVLLIAMVRKWRKPWYFLILLLASFAGAIFLSFLYMVVALPLAQWIGGINATDSDAWRVFHMIISNLILLAVPIGMLFGAMGFIIMCVFRLFTLVRRHRVTDST